MQTITKATDKQVAAIKKALAERIVPDQLVGYTEAQLEAGLTSARASKALSWLWSLPRTEVKVSATSTQALDLPKQGRYAAEYNGTMTHFFLGLAKSEKGWFVKTIHGDAKKYHGFLFKDGNAPKVSASLQLALGKVLADPAAAAVLYGKTTGHCCICGKTLTDPDSVGKGIGPDCAKNTIFGAK